MAKKKRKSRKDIRRQRTIRNALPTIRMLAKRMRKRLCYQVDLEDLMSAGLYVLGDVVDRFDPTKSSFSHYLQKRVTWAMLTEAKRLQRSFNPQRGRPDGLSDRPIENSRRIRVSPSCGEEIVVPSILEFRGRHRAGYFCPIGDLVDVAVQDGNNPERLWIRHEAARALHRAVARLRTPFHEIIIQHYFDGKPFAEIAETLRLSRATTSRLHQRALKLLAEALSGLEGGFEN